MKISGLASKLLDKNFLNDSKTALLKLKCAQLESPACSQQNVSLPSLASDIDIPDDPDLDEEISGQILQLANVLADLSDRWTYPTFLEKRRELLLQVFDAPVDEKSDRLPTV